MRNLLLASLLASASLVAGANEQQNQADFQGQYVLQDGSRLSVQLRQHKLMAELNDDAPTVLSATGPATFTTANGQLRIAFTQAPNGNVSGVTLTRLRNMAEREQAASADKPRY